MSIINLKECETLLKTTYNIDPNDPLIILKLEKITKVAKEKDVQYEIYDPRTFEKLDLSICDKKDIDIVMPIYLEEEIEELYRALMKEGYDLFDINDIFFTDICTPFEYKNGADILLDDRIIYYYEKIINYTECPNDCTYSKFYIETKGLSCTCQASNENIDSENINRYRKRSYYLPELKGLKYSGYRTMKCYKLVFNFKHFMKNAGSIIAIILFISYIIFMIYYIIKDVSALKISISNFLSEEIEIKDDNSRLGTVNPLLTFNGKMKKNRNQNQNQNQASETKSFKSSFLNKSKKSNKNIKKSNKKEISAPPKRQRVKKVRINSAEKRKETENIKLIDLMNQRKKIGKIERYHNIKNHKKKIVENTKKNDIDVESLKSDKVRQRKTMKDIEKERELRIKRSREFIQMANMIRNNPSIYEENKKDSNSEKKSIEKFEEIENNEKKEKDKNKEENGLDDYELHQLKYEEAIVLDNRSFCKIYWSLIKRNELFLNTFVSWNDYNLFYIKIEKFIIDILTIMTLNGFLFPDDSIHNYFLNGVKYDFSQQILPIILSFIISYIFEILLYFLVMTDRYFYEVKALSKIEGSKNKIIDVLRGMKMKLMAFYIGGTFFAFFYWYAISAFCSVYLNTQSIYIIDCVISFPIFLIVPFIVYALIALLRIISLKSVNHKKLKWLYKMSQMLPIF